MRLPRSRLALALSVVAVIVLAFAVTASVGLLTGDGIHLGSVEESRAAAACHAPDREVRRP